MMIKVGVCGFAKKYYNLVNVVELQRTFYNIPMKKTVQRWRDEAPENFELTFKVFQGLTHPSSSPTWRKYRGRLDPDKAKFVGNLQLNKFTEEIMLNMVEIAKTLRSPVMVVQTPKRFDYSKENVERAVKFFKRFDELLNKENVNSLIGWEPRGNWLEKSDSIRETCMEIPRLIHVTDPFFNEPAVVKDLVYFRLHGKPHLNYKYRYTKEDYKELYEKIMSVMNRGNVESVYVMFNNIKMLDNAREFEKFIKEES